MQNFHLQNLLIMRTDFTSKKKLEKIKNIFRELWLTLKSLVMSSWGGRESKILEENGVVSFNSQDNANTIYRFFLNFHIQKIYFESKLLKSTISRFVMNVRMLFYVMQM